MLDIVNIMLAFAVALTYPLQFYAAIEVLEKKVGLADDPAAEGLGLPTAPQQPRGLARRFCNQHIARVGEPRRTGRLESSHHPPGTSSNSSAHSSSSSSDY